MPFNNEFFDKIFHVHSSYFWTADLPETLVEIMRVLKPGGLFVSGMYLKKLELLEKGRILRRRQFDPARYIFELEPAGFTDVKVKKKKFIVVTKLEGIFLCLLQMEYIKGTARKEYQVIYARKPLEAKELRDPDEVEAFLQSRLTREYIIERGIDEGLSLPEIERELAFDKSDDKVPQLDKAKDKPLQIPGSKAS
ncbi:unnamed protein product [Gongylonema pulchrum]|uniref:Methyltransferase type 11 domain-containing protein n=1 Tax=Gongylonema pulchrum TaxID=637853 RepID=A0A3P6PRI2_9BILA|nr:unnamed protein product [Gongylonema pulchrum]